MKISRIFQLLTVLAFGVMCCLLAGCGKKCIVPVPTLTYTTDGLIYKPDASIAGVTQIKLNVSDATTNASILGASLAPGDSIIIPDSVLASPILVRTEYLSASGLSIAKDGQILDGICQTYIGAVDVVIIRPEDSAALCGEEPDCTLPPNPSTNYIFSWPTSTDPIKKMKVGSVSFLVRWIGDNTVEIIPCNENEYDVFTEGEERRNEMIYTSRNSPNTFSLTFTQDQNSPTGGVTITLSIGSPTTGLPACIN